MRKFFYFMLLLTAIITFTACNDEDNKNTLSGTTWSTSYGSATSFVIEFEDNSKVTGFRTDANGKFISGSICHGTYSFTDNIIVFDDFTLSYSFLRFHFTDGTVSGNYMTLNYWESYSGTRYDHQMTFRKQ